MCHFVGGGGACALYAHTHTHTAHRRGRALPRLRTTHHAPRLAPGAQLRPAPRLEKVATRHTQHGGASCPYILSSFFFNKHSACTNCKDGILPVGCGGISRHLLLRCSCALPRSAATGWPVDALALKFATSHNSLRVVWIVGSSAMDSVSQAWRGAMARFKHGGGQTKGESPPCFDLDNALKEFVGGLDPPFAIAHCHVGAPGLERIRSSACPPYSPRGLFTKHARSSPPSIYSPYAPID
jgi:hypothetical protein